VLPSFTPTAPAGSPPDLDNLPTGPGAYGYNQAGSYDQAGPAGSGIRISGALRHSAAASGGNGGGASPGGTSPGGRRGGRHGTSEVPVVTGVPVTRPTAPPGSSFDVFTPLRRSEQGAGDPAGDAVSGGASEAPYAESYQDPFAGSSPAQQSSAEAAYAETSYGGGSYRNNTGDGDGYQRGDLTDGSGDYKGLPRRVRQANLAPELRSSAAAGSNGPTGVPQASTASLSDMRTTLSAMQRGWQQGRSQPQQDTEDGVDGE
jgi:hypothetical protein